MRAQWVEWEGAAPTAITLRRWTTRLTSDVDINEILTDFAARGDQAVLDLTNRFDATRQPLSSLPVDPVQAEAALAALEPQLREAMELASANIRAVAEAQLVSESSEVTLPQGQTVTVREVPMGSAGIYAPGGRAAYPSSVLMCAIPAQIAGIDSISLASPPGPDGRLHPLVLAAAALCGIDEIYAMGGAGAILALAYGTETVIAVDVVVGPGNAWVREAKRAVCGRVAIDSYAGPSELMVIAGPDTDVELAALDLCAQAEHGVESPLVAVADDGLVLEAIAAATDAVAATRPSVSDAQLALVQTPDVENAIAFANCHAPEHLQLMATDAALLADRVTTAGCVFVGARSATAFGDYVAGSNHVLPTGGAGRFSGPLGPSVFRRKIATVEVSAEAAAKLAPHVEAIARAEGFPVHGESAMIRARR